MSIFYIFLFGINLYFCRVFEKLTLDVVFKILFWKNVNSVENREIGEIVKQITQTKQSSQLASKFKYNNETKIIYP